MKKHIFIIDDDPISTIILKKNLELIAVFKGIETFNNGKDAFNFLEKEYQKEDKYIIFLDLNMPEMNGWEFLDKVKHVISSHNTTIYVLTSSINKADMEKTTQFSLIEKYISKPIDKKILIEIKEKYKL
ncbi:response regulator [Flavobacterium proteolyticum]|uniref:Response regulator n=1 Tax=Flavobacterium proteolyticum TaxID=2911683 RepID=A0ABR9WSW6_9FLAO|nr:response regulator [Flavobacterium proteolyticum]MBE9576411.1 response regulator [Flavobacterium proteolyticum]